MLNALQLGLRSGITTFYVNSRGGRESLALQIAEAIESHKVSVVVDGACLSACSQYLLAAARRVTIRPGSMVSFHLNSYGLLKTHGFDRTRLSNVAEIEGNAKAAEALYRRHGLNPVFLADITSAMRPTCFAYQAGGTRLFGEVDAWVPTMAELKAYGFKFEGFWPTSPVDYSKLSSTFYDRSSRVYFGPLSGVKRSGDPDVGSCPAGPESSGAGIQTTSGGSGRP